MLAVHYIAFINMVYEGRANFKMAGLPAILVFLLCWPCSYFSYFVLEIPTFSYFFCGTSQFFLHVIIFVESFQNI